MTEPPSGALRTRIESLVKASCRAFVPTEGGYSPAARWRVRTASGAWVFVKMGTNEHTRRALRNESRTLRAIAADRGLDFAPRWIAFEDDDDRPLLVIEDLGDARWPPPWDAQLVEEVRQTMARMHETEADLEPFEVVHAGEERGWAEVAKDPAPFLELGLASSRWLDASLGILLAAEAAVSLGGEALTHFDVRSDNLCRAPRGVVLIDWNLACRGNPELDLGFWLPSLALEGGPLPDTLLPHRPKVAAWVSGFFAARAGLPLIPSAPRVRAIQLAQLRTALPWAMRALELAPLDGAAVGAGESR